MRKKILIASFAILLVSILSATGAFVFHFYYLFGNSNQLFRIRHNHFSHLEFHTDQWSYFPGELISLYISNSRGDSVQISVYEIEGKDTLIANRKSPAFFQSVDDSVSILGTHWDVSEIIDIPSDVKTGWYLIEVKNAEFKRYTSIFIKPKPENRKNRIAILFSTNTWNAYNHWGGQSLYSRNTSHQVSFQRPQILANPFIENTYVNHQAYYQAANMDRHFVRLLDSAGIGYDAYSMDDLEWKYENLLAYDKLVLLTHSEYWSWNMVNHLNTCLDSGASLIALAGNICAYVATRDTIDRSMTVYKMKGHLWSDADTAQIRPFGTEFSYDGFHTYAPYEVLVDTSWIFAGTGLKNGDLFGKVSDVFDYTVMYDSWWENLLSLSRKGSKGAASGQEIDKVYFHTPGNWVTIASGLNPTELGHAEVYPDPKIQWKKNGGADMGYYKHPGGGIVFNVGSMGFTGGIGYDKSIQQMLLNLLLSGRN